MGQIERPPDAPTRSAREHATLLLARALVDRARALYRELEERTGAPVQAHRAMALIASEPGIQSSRLAAALGMQRSAVSHLLRPLQQRGWIERRRDSADQRSVHLFVTNEGSEVVKATAGRVVGVLQHAVEQLDDTQLAEAERSLHAILQHMVMLGPRADVPAVEKRRPAKKR
jgi:MarR family transcriptional regulator, organic hydroperoxide resistance regulator